MSNEKKHETEPMKQLSQEDKVTPKMPKTLGEIEDGFNDGSKIPEERMQFLNWEYEKRREIATQIAEIIFSHNPKFDNAISILEEAEMIIKRQKVALTVKGLSLEKVAELEAAVAWLAESMRDGAASTAKPKLIRKVFEEKNSPDETEQ